MARLLEKRASPGIQVPKEAGGGWALILGLALLVLLTRLPFRSQMLFNWDAADFALGLRHYDVTQFQPHPPGYFLYIMTAKAISLLVDDHNASLVAESILFSMLAVAVLFFLGRDLFGRLAGFLAALLLAGSVTFWTYGEVGLTYVTLAFWSGLVAWLAYRIVFRRENLLLLLVAAYALAAGFRAELLLFLAPLVGLSLWRQPPSKVALALGLAALLLALWALPMMVLSGGPAKYLAVLTAYSDNDVFRRYSVLSRGIPALVTNVRDTASYVFYAMYAIALPFVAALVWWALSGWRRWGSEVLFLALWTAPMLLFYNLIHVGDPGYVFSFYPALLLLTAAFLAWLPHAAAKLRRGRASEATFWSGVVVGLALAAVVANSLIFLFHQRPLTLYGIRQQDATLRAKVDYLADNFPAESTVLLASDSVRHLRYYLPHYESRWVDRLSPREQQLRLPPETRAIVLFDSDLVPLVQDQSRLEQRQVGEVIYSWLATSGSQALVYSSGGVALR